MRRTGPGWATTKLAFLIVLLVAATAFGAVRVGGVSTGLPVTPSGPGAPAADTTPHGMYAYYYLWWSSSHWQSSLGPNFPFNRSPLPLPATLDASGCNPSSLYSGNVETDSPAALFSQDDPGQINYDVQSAIAAGLTGFAVDWNGTGTPGQTPASDSENARLDMLVHAVDRAQAAGQDFHLWISYKASATILTQSAITADLGYLTSQYGHDPAFDRSNGGKPTLIWVGSYKYPLSVVAPVTTQFRPSWYLVGATSGTPGTARSPPTSMPTAPTGRARTRGATHRASSSWPDCPPRCAPRGRRISPRSPRASTASSTAARRASHVTTGPP